MKAPNKKIPTYRKNLLLAGATQLHEIADKLAQKRVNLPYPVDQLRHQAEIMRSIANSRGF